MLSEILYLWPSAYTNLVNSLAEARQARANGIQPSSGARQASKPSSFARIDVRGPLMRYNTFESWWYGWSTYVDIYSQFETALKDPNVKSILLMVDSPGGDGNGVEQLAAALKASSKPTTALISGLGCSAAYWLASSCDQVFATPSSIVGSVGTYLTHIDKSQLLEKLGIRATEIASTEWKVAASPVRPLDEQGKQYLQDLVDQLNNIFVDAVIGNRFNAILKSSAPKKSKAEIISAKVFLASQAKSLGLIDGVVDESKFLAGLQSIDGYNVSLKSVGTAKLDVAKAISNSLHCSIAEAKKIIESKTEFRIETKTELSLLRASLLSAGAEIEVKEVYKS